MKRNFITFFLILILILIFLNYDLILTSTLTAVDIWLKKVFPYLFIMIIINDLLINLDLARYFKNPSLYIFIMSLLSGTPTSAYIIKNLYNTHQLSLNNANISLIFTYFCNPLFLFTILMAIFKNINITLKLMAIHYLSNLILYFIFKNKLTSNSLVKQKTSFNLAKAITNSMNTVTMVLGTIVLFFVLSSIFLKIMSFSIFNATLFRGFLEITQGLNSLINLQITTKIKEIIAIAFISFGGLSIHTQISCILNDTDITYQYFFKGRIYGTIIALILTCIT